MMRKPALLDAGCMMRKPQCENVRSVVPPAESFEGKVRIELNECVLAAH
jgi:hypothetical protein